VEDLYDIDVPAPAAVEAGESPATAASGAPIRKSGHRFCVRTRASIDVTQAEGEPVATSPDLRSRD